MALSRGLLLSNRKLPRHEDNEAPGLAGGEDENRTPGDSQLPAAEGGCPAAYWAPVLTALHFDCETRIITKESSEDRAA